MKTFFRIRLVDFAKIQTLTILLAATAAALGQPGPDAGYPTNQAAAEKFYAEGSYAKAREIYGKVDSSFLSREGAHWVAFRCADTQWRSQAATDNPDPTKLDEARASLEKQIRDLTREDQHDRVWAEVRESLGDFSWTRRNNYNWYNDWNGAWPHYQAALDWWAGRSDLELARQRYLKIVWKMSRPPASGPFYYGGWGNLIPLEIFENATKIAQSDEDKAHAHYLIAMTLRNQGDWEQRARVPEEFAATIKPGKKTGWYDDALFNYAQWMEQNGRPVRNQNGNWSSQPDFVKALALFRQFTNEFAKGESRYWEQAQNEINNITEPQVNVSVRNIFLPGSEIQYFLNWRNVKRLQLKLYPVELNRDVHFPPESKEQRDWLQSIDLSALEKIKSWTRNTKDKGDYQPGNAAVRLDPKLKPGAYVLEASAGGKQARELILVTDAALVLKMSGRQALVYFCNALDSAPIANAPVKLWENWWADNRWHSRSLDGTTGTNGIVVIPLDRKPDNSVSLFASAQRADRQAFSSGQWYRQGASGLIIDPVTGLPRADLRDWRIYAFTDRPAYRPKETTNWKFIARRYNGSVYSTPANETIEYEITDPRGAKVKSDKIKLNEFGSAWDSLDLTEKMPLGEYRVTFWDQVDGKRHHEIGSATLFRLEEYKLPEFKVSVTTPEENGQKKAFRLGETVEATIQADYYFGGPVANADVAVLVHQKPFWHFWHEPRPYPWFYEDMDNGNSPYGRWRGWYGGDQIITNATLKTDATGKATLTFATPRNIGQDYEYDIEARVTDASRREISGSGTVRVTRQRYYVYANPAHNLYRPQDKVTVDFKALDANDQPVQTEGKVTVTRDYWYEIWLAPDGREVKGDELKRLQAQSKIWPPAPARPDQKEWRLKFRGYEHDDVLTQSLKTGTNGEAELTFTPEREGYYREAWSGEDVFTNQPPQPINADTTVWIAKNSTTELGYRTGGVEIIADKDTFRVGGDAPVMLVAPAAGRYVLFTVEGEDLYHYQLVHLDGTVKLVNLAVDEKYVPNVFLGATLVSDRQIFTDTKQIVVPPVKNFLNVEVKPDRAQYQPRDEGMLTIATKNDEGKPVSAEVALSLADESVFYIQNDYAGDPRQFYFGTKRSGQIQTQATMNQKNYARLVEWENNQLIDDQEKERLETAKREQPEQLKNGKFAWKKDFDFNGGVATDSLDDAEKDRSDGRFGGGGGAGGLRYAGAIGGSTFAVNAATAEMPAGMPAMPPLLNGISGVGSLTRAKMPEGRFPGNISAGEEPAVVVRSDFRSTIFWQPDIVTDKNGLATVKVKYPDSLTSWKATARAVTAVNQFGIADATTRTRQSLIVRLEAPRFFVVGDTVTISAVINNNTDKAMRVLPFLDMEGLTLVSGPAGRNPQALYEVPFYTNVLANDEARVDWEVKVKKSGNVKLKAGAWESIWPKTNGVSDAMEKTFIAYEHGIEKFISKSGKARGGDVTVNLVLPHDRKADSTTLTVQVTPSMAVTMLDALPYLINYPYGCTEQTMSRFLPTVITARTLRDAGLQSEDVMGRVFGGIETNSAAATHPNGKKNLEEMDKMTQAGLDRLYDFQHGDGGWGWWKEGDSDHWMTAYVVWGLSLARDAGVQVKDDVLRRGAKYLDEHLVEEEENSDMQAWMLHAYSAYIIPYKNNPGLLGKFIYKAEDNLWNRRDALNAYTRALFAWAEHNLDNHARAKILIANLENGVIRDDRPDNSVLIGGSQQPNAEVMGTAHWGNDGIYWHWSDGGVEATAFALRALLAIDPTNSLVEPVSNWLIKNRRGAQWNNTRDTAIVVLALNDYLRTSGELHPDLSFEVYVNGTKVADRKISGADVFDVPSTFTIDPKLIQDTNQIRILRTSGGGSLYFSSNAKFFSTEEPIAPAGNEIFVKREYYKLAGRPTLLKGYVYDREPLRDGETVASGERVETVLTVEAKNNYEYLLFEDLKAAGFEAVAIRSGEDLYARGLMASAVERKFGATSVHEIKPGETLSLLAKGYGVSVAEIEMANSGIDPKRLRIGDKLVIPATQSASYETGYNGSSRWVYQELRDRQVALFIDHLPQGVWQIRYDFRAEAPGQFHALPVLGRTMYVPEIRCNSSELRVNVMDQTP